MKHEVFVPVPAETMRQALADPARVAACLPGLQPDPDAGADAIAGRLRLRIGGSTITYRGTLRVTERAEGFAVEGEGTEARGSGTVKLALEIAVEDAERETPGAVLRFTGTVRAEGRLASFDEHVTVTAGRRLLERFADELAAGLPPGLGEEPDVVDGIDESDEINLDDEVDLVQVELEVPETVAGLDDLEPAAEAAHARRTMIGRSAEEVDHAPPRGRYAPVPAPAPASARATLRWAVPAAAALVATAVIAARALRRHK